jgi:hypothetical protein
MKSALLPTLLLGCALPFALQAQVFDAPGNNPPANQSGGNNNNTSGAQGSQSKPVIGNEMPMFNPGTEVVSWNGQNWNVGDQRVLRARFEKYLAAPPATSAADQAYRDLLLKAMKALSPNNPGGPNASVAVAALGQAAEHPIDARLCDSLNQAVYSVVLYKKNNRLLADMNKALAQRRKDEAWNLKVESAPPATTKTTTEGKDGKPVTVSSTVNEFSESGNRIKNMVEIDATRVANATKMGAAELRAKVEFQAMIVQFFLQRRFEHCIIASRLYRVLFEDGDAGLKLKEGSDVEKLFVQSTGVTPTVSALDAMASEAIRDVDEGVQAFVYLAERDDLESASKRLAEAFVVGEYLPRIRTLERGKKDKVQGFVRQANQLISAIDVKDYTLAEELVESLRKTAKDFDYSKPRAAIETARSASGLHIQKARSAAIAKDDKAVAENITQAALIWPTNPDLKAFSTQVAAYGDMHTRVLNDLDTLIAQKNFREIYREQQKYAGAVLGKPEYEQKLKSTLEEVAKVERVVMTADEMVKAGDTAGAWERLEDIAEKFPDDNEVNRRRADLSRKNPEFIHAITEARRHEENDRPGISLSWFLRARRAYPGSIFAKQGIERIADKILPEKAGGSL